LATTIIFSIDGTDWNNTHNILLNWVISPFSAISGVFCVVLAAKGRLSTWTWGIANSLLYGYVALYSGWLGDAMINLIWFFPTQFVGLFMWKKLVEKRKNRELNNNSVPMRSLNWKQYLIFISIGIFLILLFALLLHNVDNWFTEAMQRNHAIYEFFTDTFGSRFAWIGPVLDSSTEILQLSASILMILAFKQQWNMWIATNVISIIMWIFVLVSDPSSASWAVPTLVMWIAYLINSFYGYNLWTKGSKSEIAGAKTT
jgi:nicotinamide mononucleotide transporter